MINRNAQAVMREKNCVKEIIEITNGIVYAYAEDSKLIFAFMRYSLGCRATRAS